MSAQYKTCGFLFSVGLHAVVLLLVAAPWRMSRKPAEYPELGVEALEFCLVKSRTETIPVAEAGPSPNPSTDPCPADVAEADPSPNPSTDPCPADVAEVDPSPNPSTDPCPADVAEADPSPNLSPDPCPADVAEADPPPNPSTDPCPADVAEVDPPPNPSTDPCPADVAEADPLPSPSSANLISCSADVELVGALRPVYPRSSRRRGEEGEVSLEVDVAADGAVADVRVVRSSGVAALDNAALQAMARAKFKPAMHDGLPVCATVTQVVSFRLGGG